MIKGIIGAVIGDIAGSSRESKPVLRKTFKLFTKESYRDLLYSER